MPHEHCLGPLPKAYNLDQLTMAFGDWLKSNMTSIPELAGVVLDTALMFALMARPLDVVPKPYFTLGRHRSHVRIPDPSRAPNRSACPLANAVSISCSAFCSVKGNFSCKNH